MRSKKSACVKTMVCSCCLFTMGCTAIDAIVGGPEKHFGSASPERLAVIARTFEEQERFAQAQFMYTQLLKADPNNPTATARLQYLALAGSSSEPGISETAAVVVADSEIRPQAREEPLGSTHVDHPPKAALLQGNLGTALTFHTRPEPALSQVGGGLEEEETAITQYTDAVSSQPRHADWDTEVLNSPKTSAIRFVSLSSRDNHSMIAENAFKQRSLQDDVGEVESADLAVPFFLKHSILDYETTDAIQGI